jgi:hypothetical protein
MRISGNYFENTSLGMQYAVDYVLSRMRTGPMTLPWAASRLREIAEKMDKIVAEYEQERINDR